MVTASKWVEEKIHSWVDSTCPHCGVGVSPIWHSILSTYVIQCKTCGNLLETFELYHDTTGRLYTENHELHDRLGAYPYHPRRRR